MTCHEVEDPDVLVVEGAGDAAAPKGNTRTHALSLFGVDLPTDITSQARLAAAKPTTGPGRVGVGKQPTRRQVVRGLNRHFLYARFKQTFP